jgi:nucleoside-diphosphate kinase
MKSLSSYLSNNDNKFDPFLKNHVLAVIKPGNEHLIGDICNIFKENGYTIVKTKTTRLTLQQAQQLYKVHAKEDFYSNLCNYMSSGPTTAFILKKKSDNIFDEFAKLKDKIREDFGESDMRNVLHSSDSYKSFTHESQVYFYNVNQNDLL